MNYYFYRDNVFKQESESEDEEEKLEMKSKYDLMLTDEKVSQLFNDFQQFPQKYPFCTLYKSTLSTKR